MGTMIYNATIAQMVEVPDDAVDAYLQYPEYSREAPSQAAKGKKAADSPADPPPADPPVETP